MFIVILLRASPSVSDGCTDLTDSVALVGLTVL